MTWAGLYVASLVLSTFGAWAISRHGYKVGLVHNVFLSIFVSGGVVGLFLWLLIIGYAVMILIADLIKNQNLFNIPVIISIVTFHIYGLFQTMQYIPRIGL